MKLTITQKYEKYFDDSFEIEIGGRVFNRFDYELSRFLTHTDDEEYEGIFSKRKEVRFGKNKIIKLVDLGTPWDENRFITFEI